MSISRNDSGGFLSSLSSFTNYVADEIEVLKKTKTALMHAGVSYTTDKLTSYLPEGQVKALATWGTHLTIEAPVMLISESLDFYPTIFQSVITLSYGRYNLGYSYSLEYASTRTLNQVLTPKTQMVRGILTASSAATAACAGAAFVTGVVSSPLAIPAFTASLAGASYAYGSTNEEFRFYHYCREMTMTGLSAVFTGGLTMGYGAIYGVQQLTFTAYLSINLTADLTIKTIDKIAEKGELPGLKGYASITSNSLISSVVSRQIAKPFKKHLKSFHDNAVNRIVANGIAGAFSGSGTRATSNGIYNFFAAEDKRVPLMDGVISDGLKQAGKDMIFKGAKILNKKNRQQHSPVRPVTKDSYVELVYSGPTDDMGGSTGSTKSRGHLGITIVDKGDEMYVDYCPDKKAGFSLKQTESRKTNFKGFARDQLGGVISLFNEHKGKIDQIDGGVVIDNEDRVIRIYNLDLPAMKEKLNKKMSNTTKWKYAGSVKGADLGSQLFSSYGTYNDEDHGKSESCASFAWKLLKAGGIEDLMPSLHLFHFTPYISPKNLFCATLDAKYNEYENSPITREFDQENSGVLSDVDFAVCRRR